MLIDAAAREYVFYDLIADYTKSGVLLSHLCKALCVSDACICD